MKVLKVERFRAPEAVEMDNTLEALQGAVDGYIEVFRPWRGPVAVICNEEGKLRGMGPNIRIGTEILAGTILVVGLDGEEFRGLTEDEITKYTALLNTQERF